ncbi:sensor histidine kinase [Pseudomonas sp. 2FG]|uniref:sensor histidine kinase n=1 Tax=Pseudomonas sp. 2FG TaxID=2502191 RepID=UPI0010F587C6|nr:sensor histidine kinase [Pseudomonas sp. 2FG]
MSTEAKIASHPEALAQESDPVLPEPSPGPTSNRRLSWWQRACAPLGRLSRSAQFAIAASIILGLTMAFVGNLVSKSIERSAVQAAAEAGALYMATFLEPYVQELSTAQRLSAETAQAIDHLMSSPSLNTHIRSVKIWNPDGTVIYSTNKTVVNKTFPASDEIIHALAGNTVTEWGELVDEENAYERSLGIPLYEIYAPLREFGSGRIVAVGEFYETAGVLQREIDRIRRDVWTIVGAATLAMLTLLFCIVRRADRIIERQQVTLKNQMREQAQLLSQNLSLQRKITTANQEFSRINELTLRRLGADLHDGPAQLLTLILVRLDELDILQDRYRQNGGQLDGDALETLRNAAQDALREIRDISRGLALPEINGMTLRQELELVVLRHEQRTETKVNLSCGSLPESLPLPHKICLYRFVQEALNNAYHHAGGIGQAVHATYDGGVLEVQITDAGQGITAECLAAANQGRTRLGLAGMRYRVESLGGVFRIESTPNVGTQVIAQLQL